MSEWKTDHSGAQRFTVGTTVSFVVEISADWRDGLSRLGVEIEKHPQRTHDNDDAARAAAEAKMREMYETLAQHFAPVLRWVDSGGGAHTASLGDWTLDAAPLGWALFLRKQEVFSGWTETNKRDDNQRAAEAALRALGVPFRVEGE